jgi:hypothetical protein
MGLAATGSVGVMIAPIKAAIQNGRPSITKTVRE